MIVVVAKYLIPKGFVGIALWPFVLLASDVQKNNPSTIAHERIHLRQQLEMLVVPFFVWYGLEYLIRLAHYKDRKLAYRNISFEREAYANEKSPDYLKTRAFWFFVNYI
ncbi:hypothetical protein [Flavobacterium selenitireducens]|uniref:hypothetical protein n=1 Tax=Flavobacterium selenitireducens TaxID=2722704 RepID=UPI00168BC3DE|nr:hypothetical protein [Flavobacterium selenitireducens]MBD3583379.1 hypothetical protein [Flavobacterium selenitireducens]